MNAGEMRRVGGDAMADDTDSQNADESRDSTLEEFGRCADFMRKVLHQDAALDDTEFLFIENHFHVLEMAYLRWKRKHQPHLSAVGGGHEADTSRLTDKIHPGEPS
jgi:hypothetical protein